MGKYKSNGPENRARFPKVFGEGFYVPTLCIICIVHTFHAHVPTRAWGMMYIASMHMHTFYAYSYLLCMCIASIHMHAFYAYAYLLCICIPSMHVHSFYAYACLLCICIEGMHMYRRYAYAYLLCICIPSMHMHTFYAYAYFLCMCIPSMHAQIRVGRLSFFFGNLKMGSALCM